MSDEEEFCLNDTILGVSIRACLSELISFLIFQNEKIQYDFNEALTTTYFGWDSVSCRNAPLNLSFPQHFAIY